MKIKKIFLSMLLMIVSICFCPTKVFATSTIERTTTLDVSKFIQDEENKEEGWSWNSTTNTLTLTNVNFNTGDNMSIVLPSDRDIHIVSNGNNKLISSKTVISGKKDGPGFIIFGGNGLLELNSKKELPTIDANDLLFESGTVNAIGGSIITMQTIKVDGGYVKVDTSQVSDDGWTDGLYACGSIEISSGTVDIISNRVGIFATGTGHPNPTTGIKITGGNIDVSAKLYGMCSGNNTYKKDVYIETTGTIDFKDSSIGIALANGNLTIKKGNIILKEGNQLYVNSKSNTQGTVTIEKADYTKVNEAKSKVPADLSVYTDESVKALQDALAAVVEDKDVTEQIAVNGYATSIENAIVGLKYKPADYTKVNEAKAKVPSNLNIYTEETVNALQEALDAVEEGKNITEQETVDGYANAINEAISKLVLKDADYKKVNEAKAKVPSNLNIYTEETVNALQEALDAVEEGKNITEQTEVDAMAKAIYEAISKLVLKDANYKKVNEAKAKVPSNLTIYTKETVNSLQEALDAVKEGKKITEQETVDGYAKAIYEAISKLVLKDATSTKQEAVKPTVKVETTNKETVKAENKKEVKKVKTGDSTNSVLYLGLFGFSLLIIYCIVMKKFIR